MHKTNTRQWRHECHYSHKQYHMLQQLRSYVTCISCARPSNLFKLLLRLLARSAGLASLPPPMRPLLCASLWRRLTSRGAVSRLVCVALAPPLSLPTLAGKCLQSSWLGSLATERADLTYDGRPGKWHDTVSDNVKNSIFAWFSSSFHRWLRAAMFYFIT